MTVAALIERWRRQLLGPERAEEPEPSSPQQVAVDFPAVIERAFPDEFPIAWRAVERVLACVAETDLSPLARRSPALQGYDWPSYLKCSVARMVRVMRALRQLPPAARVLDYGAYFGNFSLACHAAGYSVDAVDSYAAYECTLTPCVDVMRRSGIGVMDFGELGSALDGVPAGRYDAVLCMGVIEHVPHTPRVVLEAVSRVLRPGGLLVLDTPNLAYLYKRLALVDGGTIFSPLPLQYHTEIPFEGHHREYTIDEVRWMLNETGHDLDLLETFNYSVFGQTMLTGEDVERHRVMAAHDDLREVIFTVSRRRAA